MNIPSKTLKSPLISIVTPVFNQEKTLKEAIESVLRQTYSNIEYIVINDGSIDSTSKILKGYDNTFKVITQDNRGQSEALNRAWHECSGDFLTYLSADDVLYPNCIEELVLAIDDSSVVYYPDYDLIDHQSKILRSIATPDYNRRDLICHLQCQPGLAAIFKTDIFKKTEGWDSSYEFIPDFEFWTRMAAFGDFKRVAQVLGGFRIHQESGSVRSIKPSASDEIIHFVNNYQGYLDSSCKDGAEFRSQVMSARSHLQSGRLIVGLRRYLKALAHDPFEAVKFATS